MGPKAPPRLVLMGHFVHKHFSFFQTKLSPSVLISHLLRTFMVPSPLNMREARPKWGVPGHGKRDNLSFPSFFLLPSFSLPISFPSSTSPSLLHLFFPFFPSSSLSPTKSSPTKQALKTCTQDHELYVLNPDVLGPRHRGSLLYFFQYVLTIPTPLIFLSRLKTYRRTWHWTKKAQT